MACDIGKHVCFMAIITPN